MGLLDTIGVLAGQLGGGQNQADPKTVLVQGVIAMLTNNSSQAGGSGGLAGLIQQFGSAGLGNLMSSWVSSGHNLPISAEQISSVLSNGQLQQLAEQTGLGHSEIAGHLSEMLPGIIDKLTPQGQLPQSGFDASSVQSALGGILGQFLGNKA